ncbi:MAG: glycosyltransferase family 4 protein, partial [Aggregatilineales bacterium]
MSESQRPALIVDLSKYYGGADVRVMTVAQALHDIGYPYGVAILEGSPVHEKLVDTGLTTFPVPHSRSDPRMITFLRSLITREGFRVVDGHNPQSQFWGHSASGTLKGVHGVSTVNSSYGPEHDYSMKGRAYEQILEMNRLAGCHFIAITAAIESYLLDERKL